MKLYCEVPLKDKSRLSIFDAIAYASRHAELWKIRETKSEQRARTMHRTNLNGKCGSCKSFCPFKVGDGVSCYGNCSKGRATRPRTTKACADYERL